MADKPTAEQVAEARNRLTTLLSSDLFRRTTAARNADALRIILAVMEPPTDEVLDTEAALLWKLGEADGEAHAMTWEAFRAIYRAGARREGRHAKP